MGFPIANHHAMRPAASSKSHHPEHWVLNPSRQSGAHKHKTTVSQVRLLTQWTSDLNFSMPHSPQLQTQSLILWQLVSKAKYDNPLDVLQRTPKPSANVISM